MALRGIFGGKNKDNTPSQDLASLGESTYLAVSDGGSYALATVLCEKYTDREAGVLLAELTDAAAQREHRLVVDLHKVMMLASAGIGSLIHLHKTCTKAKGKLVLAGIDEEILSMLKVTKMDKLLTIVETVDKASAKMG